MHSLYHNGNRYFISMIYINLLFKYSRIYVDNQYIYLLHLCIIFRYPNILIRKIRRWIHIVIEHCGPYLSMLKIKRKKQMRTDRLNNFPLISFFVWFLICTFHKSLITFSNMSIYLNFQFVRVNFSFGELNAVASIMIIRFFFE